MAFVVLFTGRYRVTCYVLIKETGFKETAIFIVKKMNEWTLRLVSLKRGKQRATHLLLT